MNTISKEHYSTVLSLYKSKGTRDDCHNYRGISPLLTLPGKTFAHILLSTGVQGKLLQSMRIQQSEFPQGRSTMMYGLWPLS